MKAEVKSSGKIVDLVTKRGEYFIDTDSNPYKEDELDFDVLADALAESPLPFDPARLFGLSMAYNVQHGIQLASLYMTRHPEATGAEVGDFVAEVVKRIKNL